MRALHKLDAAIHRFLIDHSIQLVRIAVEPAASAQQRGQPRTDWTDRTA